MPALLNNSPYPSLAHWLRCLRRDPQHRPTISGPEGLLSHPFLCTATTGALALQDHRAKAVAEGIEASEKVHKTVEATLKVIESHPEVMQVIGRQRLGAVYKVRYLAFDAIAYTLADGILVIAEMTGTDIMNVLQCRKLSSC